VRPGVWAAARYDLNLYSHVSDVAVGVAWHHDGRQLKLRVSANDVSRNPRPPAAPSACCAPRA
jgi:hypothetical protein